MRGSYVARLIVRDDERRQKALALREAIKRGDKEVLIRANEDYIDKELNKSISKGQVYDVSDDRAKYIEAHGLCTIVDKKEPIIEEAIKKVAKRNAKSR